jgi:molybdenum cofactor cytidylyltransferase
MISGILLAAGESKRMQGAFKPLLKWGKRTVIGECVHQLRNSQLADIIVVLGYREFDVRTRLAGTGVQYAINKDYQRGMLSSIKTGLELISPNTDAFLLALVDQPMIRADLINRLIEAYTSHDQSIVLPTYEGRRGHPLIISTSHIDDIMQLDDQGEGGLRDFISANQAEILEVPVETPAVTQDIDLPEDYERLSQGIQPLYEYHKWHP